MDPSITALQLAFHSEAPANTMEKSNASVFYDSPFRSSASNDGSLDRGTNTSRRRRVFGLLALIVSVAVLFAYNRSTCGRKHDRPEVSIATTVSATHSSTIPDPRHKAHSLWRSDDAHHNVSMCHDAVTWTTPSQLLPKRPYHKVAAFDLPLDAQELLFYADSQGFARGFFDVSLTAPEGSTAAVVDLEVFHEKPDVLEEATICRIGQNGTWGFGIFVSSSASLQSVAYVY